MISTGRYRYRRNDNTYLRRRVASQDYNRDAIDKECTATGHDGREKKQEALLLQYCGHVCVLYIAPECVVGDSLITLVYDSLTSWLYLYDTIQTNVRGKWRRFCRRRKQRKKLHKLTSDRNS